MSDSEPVPLCEYCREQPATRTARIGAKREPALLCQGCHLHLRIEELGRKVDGLCDTREQLESRVAGHSAALVEIRRLIEERPPGQPEAVLHYIGAALKRHAQ